MKSPRSPGFCCQLFFFFSRASLSRIFWLYRTFWIFLVGFQGPVVPLIKIDDYFDLVLLVIVALGLVFELPVLIFFLTLFGIVTPKFLIKNTKYAVLVISVVAAIVTPTPDALTMLLVMSVMTALYFVGVGVSWIVVSRERRLAAEARG